MKRNILFCTFLFCVIVNLFSQYRAAYIPEDKLSTIKIDGDTSDWNWVSNNYILTKRFMNEVELVETNESEGINESWKCEIKVAWSDIGNRIFILAKVSDDVLVNESSDFMLNDCMQFVVNAMNNGGMYNGEVNNHCIKGHVLNTNDVPKLTIRLGPKWIKNNSKYAKSSIKTQVNEGNYMIIYEMYMTLWDKWSDMDPEHSSVSKLYPNKKIRLALIFEDVDVGTRVEWSTQAGDSWYKDANDISQFILDAPIEKGISWNNINYLLKPE